jgi:hypothetical protein
MLAAADVSKEEYKALKIRIIGGVKQSQDESYRLEFLIFIYLGYGNLVKYENKKRIGHDITFISNVCNIFRTNKSFRLASRNLRNHMPNSAVERGSVMKLSFPAICLPQPIS